MKGSYHVIRVNTIPFLVTRNCLSLGR